MAYKIRLIEKKLLEYKRFFKIVLITGARQVGKTTLLTHCFPKIKIITFDPIQDIYGVRKDPDLFLDNFPPPVILDEIQYVPELFPALKRRVDKSNATGQYFLTGSQNFSLMKNVSESLAGRVGILNLYNMTVNELYGNINDANWLEYYLNNSKFLLKRTLNTKLPLKDILWRGGMPGLLDADEKFITPFFKSYVQTYIERDLRTVDNIKNLYNFTTFMSFCAALSAQEINNSKIGNDIGISSVTAKKWYELLINSFQFFALQPYSGNTIKRISKKRKGFISDTGLLCYLQQINSPDALLASPMFGAIFETFVVSEIKKYINASGLNVNFYHWRTNSSAEVDLIIEKDGFLYPIEIKSKSNLNAYDARGLKSFRDTYKNKCKHSLIIYAGKELYKISKNITAVPWNAICKKK